MPKNSSWFKIQASAKKEEPVEVFISDVIGDDWYGTTAKQFIDSIKAYKDRVLNVRINSPGGAVFDGLAIYNYLKSRGNVNVIIDGFAASIASVIALAGDTITMGAGTFIMIHNPWSFSIGESEDLRKTADVLDQIGEQLAEIYSKVTGNTIEKVKDWMKTETWFSAEEAVQHKFATHATNAAPVKALFNFDPTKFHNAPAAALALLDGKTGGDPQNSTSENKLMKKEILALLGLNEGATPDQVEASVQKIVNSNKELTASVGTLTTERDDAKAENTKLQAKVDDYAKANAETKVEAAIVAGKIKPEAKDQWVTDFMQDSAAAQARLDSVPTPRATGTDPIPPAGNKGAGASNLSGVARVSAAFTKKK